MSRRAAILAALAVSVGLDRWLKHLAVQGAQAQAWIFHFRLFRNDGLVFSIPSSGRLALGLMIIACLVMAGLGIAAWRRNDMRPVAAVALILAGALSNLYDRFVHGYVIDWADFGPWWPIFNLADVMIAAGIVAYFWPRRKLTIGAK